MNGQRRGAVVRLLVVALVAGAGVSGCVAPARTTAAYESKAGMTAEAAVSEVRTALLAGNAYLRGRLTAAYLETVLVEAEDALGSVQATFGSIQPPATDASDAVREALDPLLEEAASGMADLRIAARRDRRAELRITAEELAGVADDLETFGKQHAA